MSLGNLRVGKSATDQTELVAEFVGQSPKMQELVRLIERIAQTAPSDAR